MFDDLRIARKALLLSLTRKPTARCVLLATLSAASTAHAEIVGIVIDQRALLHEGSPPTGAHRYEEIRGRLFGEVDPKRAGNKVMQDIELAPLNAHDKVEYISTFTLHRPVGSSTNVRVLLDFIPNRGHRKEADPTYYERGYSMVWIGWQGDLSERPSAQAAVGEPLTLESIAVPRAHARDGSLIIGRYLIRVPTGGGEGPAGAVMPLDQGSAGPLAYLPVSYDTRQARLTGGPAEDLNGKPTGQRHVFGATDWAWWNCSKDAPPESGTQPAELCVKRLQGAFSAAETYELAFTVRDPFVLSLGLAATRDALSFFRYSGAEKQNPLAGQIDYVVAQGASQSGNFVKSFIGLGFNQDERGRRVWDGANPHIAGRRLPINYRFATPGSSPTLFMPGSEGILWWGKAVDALRGGPPRSLLDRCQVSHTCPKIFETFGGAELWNQRMTPGLVNFDLKRDIPLPDNVRRYYFPGTGHGGGRGGFALTGMNEVPATPGLARAVARCTLAFNPNPETESMRALMVALVEWVAKDIAPPASRYPTLANGALVGEARISNPSPRIPPRPTRLANPVIVYNYGKQFNTVDLSGIILRWPPKIKGAVPALVASVDNDGNETAGVPSVQHRASLGTYLSWNTSPDLNAGRGLCLYTGGFVPFVKTRSERLRLGDPRLSIEERYGSRQGFVCAVKRAVEQSIKERFLLNADGARLLAQAVAATESGELTFLPKDTRVPGCTDGS